MGGQQERISRSACAAALRAGFLAAALSSIPAFAQGPAGAPQSDRCDRYADEEFSDRMGRFFLHGCPFSRPIPAPPTPGLIPTLPHAVTTYVVFFAFDKSVLTDEAQAVISEAVKTAKANGMVTVLVTGHTDTVGSDAYNLALSLRRAQAVKDAMAAQGMDPATISTEGKGFRDPLVPTGPGVREPQNRRAVIDLGG